MYINPPVSCVCSYCGTPYTTGKYTLNRGHAKSCGCLRGKQISHGHYVNDKASPTYSSWRAMHKRCKDTKREGYKYYGGRGITICPQWSDFKAFLRDMGERPLNCTLDRINNDGNYEPLNCRWATVEVQNKNRRKAYAI